MAQIRRPYAEINYDAFGENGLATTSEVLKLFGRKNERVLRIFQDSDEELDEHRARPSRSLELISIVDTEDNPESNEQSSDKENLSNKNQSSQGVRVLSPVEIIQAPANDIVEPSDQFKTPAVPLKPNRHNTSLRRSLFQQKSEVPTVNTLPCSTPMSNRLCREESFFIPTSTTSIGTLSPIRTNGTDELNENDLNGFNQIENPEEPNNRANIEVVTSLANIENDLREQYNMLEKTPQKSRAKSQIYEKSPKRRTSISVYSAPNGSQAISLLKNCSVVVEQLDLSQENIANIQNQQAVRKSNVTDINSYHMLETPVHRQANVRSNLQNSAMARKLRQCDSDITEDERSEPPSPVKQKSNGRISQSLGKRKQSFVDLTEDESSDEDHENIESNIPVRRASTSTITKNQRKSDKEKAHNNNGFRVPNIPKKSSKSILAGESDDSVRVPSEVIRSFRTLSKTKKTTDSANSSAAVKQSLKVSGPKKGRKKSRENSTVRKYFELQKDCRSKKSKRSEMEASNHKRTLYSIAANTTEEDPEVHENEVSDTDHEIRQVAANILNRQSHPSSVDFDIETHHNNDAPLDENSQLQANEDSADDEEQVSSKRSKSKSTKAKSNKNDKVSKAKAKASKDKNKKSAPNSKKSRKLSDSESETSDCDGEQNNEDNDQSVYDDFWYDPNERASCTRKGLRVRRFARPWWIRDKTAQQYKIVFGPCTKDDVRCEQKCDKIMKENNIKSKKMFDPFLAPQEKLKILENLKEQKLANGDLPRTRAKTKARTKNVENSCDQPPSKKQRVDTADSCSTSVSCQTNDTIQTEGFSEKLERLAQSNTETVTERNGIYDLVQLNSFQWVNCGNDTFFCPFMENGTDGIIKILHGGSKLPGRSKNVVLKFIVIQGKANFVLYKENGENETITVDTCGFFTIKHGVKYSITNPYETDLYVTFIKQD